MAHAAMCSVDVLTVYPVKLPHPLREISLKRLHQEVVVITHLAIGVAMPIEALASLIKNAKKPESIFIAKKDVPPFIPPGGNMVERTGKFYS